MGLLYTTVKIESVPVFSDNQMCVLVECKCGNSEIDIYITTNISSSPCALMFNQSWFTDLMGFPHISGVCTYPPSWMGPGSRHRASATSTRGSVLV